MNCALAIDIGASSGRHIVYLEKDGRTEEIEVHRFENRILKVDGHLFWDMENLEKNLILGLKKAKEAGYVPYTIGIDTFGVDDALLDDEGKLVHPVRCYQDRENIINREKAFADFPAETLYARSGTFPQYFNTFFQLYQDKRDGSLKKTKTILFFASYLYYLLTGEKYNEFSFASTSGLLDRTTKDYDEVLLDYLGLTKEQFAPFLAPGEKVGTLKKEIVQEVGYDADCIMTFTHDTASSCFGAGVKEGELFLSSGTWSLLGVMEKECHPEMASYAYGFTNEHNRPDEIRFLKNIVGMKIINQAKAELTPSLSIVDVVILAKEGASYPYVFDASDSSFLSPNSMKDEILSALQKNGYPLPKTEGELYYCIYHSLAVQYQKAIEEIEKITGKSYDTICIFGGGNKNRLLNQMTEQLTGKKVRLGPSEATSYGNYLAQKLYRK